MTLRPHPDDTDTRAVRIEWRGCRAALMSAPNDEALAGHRLYDKGLQEVLWAGEVHDSAWISELERQNRVHPSHDPSAFAHLRHFVLPLKECVVEVVAGLPAVTRVDR